MAASLPARRPVVVQWLDAFADRSDEEHIQEEAITKHTMGWLRSMGSGTLTLIHEYDESRTDIFYTTIPAALVQKVTYLEEVEQK